MSVDVQEPGGIEVVGWSADAATFLYRTRVETEHEGATIGVMVAPEGAREEVLLSLVTDPGAVPELGARLEARGVSPDASRFVAASEHAVARHAPTALHTVPLLRGPYAQDTWVDLTVSVHDCPADRVFVREHWPEGHGAPQRVEIYSAPDGRGAAVVSSWGAPGLAPARVVLDRARRTVQVVAKGVPADVVDAVSDRLASRWEVVATGPAKAARSRTVVYVPDTLGPEALQGLLQVLTPTGSDLPSPEVLPLTWEAPACAVVALGRDAARR